jgi:hypothetical protein
VDAQAVAVLVLVAAELAGEALEGSVNVAHVQLEILFARKVPQAPGTGIHADHLAALHAHGRPELRYHPERRLQGEAATRKALHRPSTLARAIGCAPTTGAAATRGRLVIEVTRARRPRLLET